VHRARRFAGSTGNKAVERAARVRGHGPAARVTGPPDAAG